MSAADDGVVKGNEPWWWLALAFIVFALLHIHTLAAGHAGRVAFAKAHTWRPAGYGLLSVIAIGCLVGYLLTLLRAQRSDSNAMSFPNAKSFPDLRSLELWATLLTLVGGCAHTYLLYNAGSTRALHHTLQEAYGGHWQLGLAIFFLGAFALLVDAVINRMMTAIFSSALFLRLIPLISGGLAGAVLCYGVHALGYYAAGASPFTL